MREPGKCWNHNSIARKRYSMITITPIPALNDNYIWMILHPASAQAVVVDPGDATPVIKILQAQNIQLTGIMITHHHWDHTNGITALLDYTPVPVYGPNSMDIVSHPLKEGDILELTQLACRFQVIEIPGHTLDHIAYLGDHSIFSGDTLFTAGCGRVFEGSFQQMYQSLEKLRQLPDNSQVYCGHEYTQANLQFAQAVEPNNTDIQQRINTVNQLRANNQATVPATLAQELKTNPFLRCHLKNVQEIASEQIGQTLTNPVETFAAIRQWKDHF
jgi:hydroxyacylglutathione hydrolase